MNRLSFLQLRNVVYSVTKCQCRKTSTQSTAPSANLNEEEEDAPKPGRMRAWQIHDYGGIESLILSPSVRMPVLTTPTDVLVRVHAASVNPVDVRMISGYGSQVLNTLRKVGQLTSNFVEFPITPGRDFAGEVVDVGRLVRGLKVGDRVYGCPAPHWQGTHADYVLAPSFTVEPIPGNLDYIEAASLPYAFMTLYSALTVTADFWIRKPSEERVLVVGASGGIGSLAVQTLKAWGAEVAGVCRTDAVPLVESLGADEVYDYTDPSWMEAAEQSGLFDLVLDCSPSGKSAGPSQLSRLVKKWRFGRYVTLSPPVLRDTDTHGIVSGAIRSGTKLAQSTVTSLLDGGRGIRWAFFMPHPKALSELSSLVDRGQLGPVIDKVFKFRDAPAAYTKVGAGSNRGKVVLAVTPQEWGISKTTESEPLDSSPTE